MVDGQGVMPQRRRAIMRNHTAAHLLQAALREVLGDHVQQAGSAVWTRAHVRFDFTHFSAVTPEELATGGDASSTRRSSEAVPVNVREMPIEEAKEAGRHGAVRRKVRRHGARGGRQQAGFSREFCGGTHVENTAQVGLL